MVDTGSWGRRISNSRFGIPEWVLWIAGITIAALSSCVFLLHWLSVHAGIVLGSATILVVLALMLAAMLPRGFAWLGYVLLALIVAGTLYLVFERDIKVWLKPHPRVASAQTVLAPTPGATALTQAPPLTAAPVPVIDPEVLRTEIRTAVHEALAERPKPVVERKSVRVHIGRLAHAAFLGRGSRWHAFCPNGGTPEEIAAKIEAAIKSDPSGHRRLAGCHANPIQFLYAFQQAEPEVGLSNFAQLERHLRQDLQLTTVPQNVAFYSSCVKGQSTEASDVIMKCDPQKIAPGEQVYANKHTGKPVFKRRCANPGLVPVAPPPPPPPCVTLSFYGYPHGSVRWGVASLNGPVPPSVCNKQRQGNGAWQPWYGSCDFCLLPQRSRDFVNRILGGVAEYFHRHRYEVVDTGRVDTFQELGFEASARNKVIYVCLTDEHGRQTKVIFVRPEDWRGTHASIPNELWQLDGQ